MRCALTFLKGGLQFPAAHQGHHPESSSALCTAFPLYSPRSGHVHWNTKAIFNMAATPPADTVQPTESSAPAHEVEAGSVDADKDQNEESAQQDAQPTEMDEQVIECMSWSSVWNYRRSVIAKLIPVFSETGDRPTPLAKLPADSPQVRRRKDSHAEHLHHPPATLGKHPRYPSHSRGMDGRLLARSILPPSRRLVSQRCRRTRQAHRCRKGRHRDPRRRTPERLAGDRRSLCAS